MRRSRLSVAAVLAVAAFGLAACGSGAQGGQSGQSDQSGQSGAAADSGKLKVVTAFYPLTYLAQEIGGDQVEITDLTPAGGEPHDLELSPLQVSQISDADLVFYLGDGFQPSVENALAEAKGATLDGMSAVPASELREGDPHVWLAPENVEKMSDQLAAELSKLDPSAAATFEQNAKALDAKLANLDTSYRDGLSQCQGATIVTSHEAFGYLANAYGLKQVGIAGTDPEVEPSPKRLTEIKDIIAENNVTTLFVESTDASQQRLGDALGIPVKGLATLESTPTQGDYISIMTDNLEQLKSGLNCG